VEGRRRRAAALAQEVADAPPTAADLATALDQLPLLDRLPELPQPELRTLFDSLRLQVAFQPGEDAVDVEVALLADDLSDRRKQVAEVQSVHLALHNTNPNPLVAGPILMLAPVQRKVRRAGYRKTAHSD